MLLFGGIASRLGPASSTRGREPFKTGGVSDDELGRRYSVPPGSAARIGSDLARSAGRPGLAGPPLLARLLGVWRAPGRRVPRRRGARLPGERCLPRGALLVARPDRLP